MNCKKTTHIRIQRDILDDVKNTYPNTPVGQVFGMTWEEHKKLVSINKRILGTKIFKEMFK